MSVDLDRAYAKLAEKIDAERVPTLSSVVQRGRQRRRRNVSVTAAVVLVLAVLSGVRFLLPTSPFTVAEPPQGFLPFDGSAAPTLAFDGSASFAMTRVDERRGYASWLTDAGEQWVAVIDLQTRRPLWDPVSLGRFGDSNGFAVADGVLIFFTEQGINNPLTPNGQDTIIAVEIETGKVLWTLPYDFNGSGLVLYRDVLVWSTPESGPTVGVNVRTGNPKWTVWEPLLRGGLHTPVSSSQTGPLDGQSRSMPETPDVVLHFASGKVQVRDANTGAVKNEVTGPPPSDPALTNKSYGLVMDDVLYDFGPDKLTRIPLTGSSAPSTVPFTGDELTMQPIPCGKNLVCVGRLNAAALVDLDTGEERWRRPADGISDLYVSGSYLLAHTNLSSIVLDRDGEVVRTFGTDPTVPMWLDGENLLLQATDGFAAMNLRSGEVTQLGRVERARGNCAWTRTLLICPTAKGISVWQYRAS